MKHIKAITDKKKSALYSKYIKEISVAAKTGGADPNNNARLKKAISDAKSQSVPKDNIERALKKASGELDDGTQLEEITYEGYGPGGVAFMVECITDKRNRTQPELRKIFEKAGGNIAEVGAVAWSFDRKGSILIKKEKASEEQLMEVALEAGAEDIQTSEDGFEITTPPDDFMNVLSAIEAASIEVEFSELGFVPQNKIPISGESESQINQLTENLEEHDDVQRVTNNAEFE